MNEETSYLTKEKFEELKKELDYLRTIKRKEVAENLEYAKGLGDLSENAEYHEARDTQAAVEDRIARIEMMLKSASIVSAHGTDVVSIGSEVTVEKAKGGEKQTFTLVGSEEADMSTGKISMKSPFGVAIMGKKKGETFSFTTPSGKMEYKVTTIK
ncbi:MAG: transcription elongation factor GreA [Candidatus Zambryskibacteria bacterium RIFCSPHIGHO2_01_FULL_43_27]|uniref:Transcription elongation factor GreA n=1 Tax=Candidatus Zambryskibacteria bacterium RIFCSPLOWO2_01_FULL_43_17 TaxID=1802760 RepID=A0A1G2U0H6_9BACT|nr:MAG: transcription elongation factor GreA [Candidatus Zambryskibacteria bacterium RIFCSPHIGHO2_01_FULL_43_27]OHB03004.1 MAG: transcription elongation factor GreA [Candidatus Zambryskibacteria bacterium RIFCSPLOWO2_01_FULL_43_17]